ncbi:MAG: TIGR04282 family arsenosugar biosynthesis glycosyltransferase [Actinobacteria bacterium]|nr:TIGR04282 family arsenosugar biosynthesis glycosyltransferase [Actinomycetota bacterium]MCA1720549.1 TIGR04282 family arsenosugar biosynthesis glycosyltransferase [Actinomycetota bacterium]
MLDAQIVVLAKQPQAGRTKTRLCPPLTPEQAADVARAALLDTLDAVAATAVRRRVVVLDGSPDELIPARFDVLPQRGAGLDERLAHAFTDTFADRSLPVLLIGMDTPQVTPFLLEQSIHTLLAAPAVLGLASDGGWWAAGLHAPDPEVFLGVPMSADDTGVHQLARLRRQGLEPVLLPALRDIDLVADLHAVAAEMPATSRTAAFLPVAS